MFDLNVLAYQNGECWYDVHPAVMELVPFRDAYERLEKEIKGSRSGAPAAGSQRVEIEGLLDGEFKAVLLAVGLQIGRRLGIPGEDDCAEVQDALAGFRSELPPGYRLSYTGQQEEQQESQAFLFSSFLWALFLIAFILISQFDSILKPVSLPNLEYGRVPTS